VRISCRKMQGRMLPKYYGKAYYEPCSDHLVVYPIPFNFIVGSLRSLWFSLKKGKTDEIEKAYNKGYGKGRQEWRTKEQKEDQRFANVIRLLRGG